MHPEVLDAKGNEILDRLHHVRGWYLAGGTALALQMGHRISVDFDLFSGQPLPPNLLARVKKAFAPHRVTLAVHNPEELTALVGGKKVTFLHNPFPVLQKMTKYRGVRLLGVKEIAATKAYTIGRRGAYKDYVDLYCVVQKKSTRLAEIISLAEKKFDQEFNARLFLEQLLYLNDLNDAPLVMLDKPLTRDELRTFFERKVRQLRL